MRSTLPLALALLLTAPSAIAQSAPTLEERMSAAEFKAAGLDKLSAEELAALNTWLHNRGGTTSSTVVPSAEQDRAGFSSEGFFGSNRDGGIDTIRSHVQGQFNGWDGENALINLANGQVWRVTDSSTRLRANLTNPKVTITRNAVGGWWLQVDGYNTRARVTRVK
jgi:hypothetical protein